MATKQNRSKPLGLRVTPREHKAFSDKAKPFGGKSALLRELVTATIEDRVTIIPNPETRSIYHES